MTAEGYATLAAVVFAIIAIVQLLRAALGWSITVGVSGSSVSIPVWLSWIAFVVLALLAWLGFAASRS